MSLRRKLEFDCAWDHNKLTNRRVTWLGIAVSHNSRCQCIFYSCISPQCNNANTMKFNKQRKFTLGTITSPEANASLQYLTSKWNCEYASLRIVLIHDCSMWRSISSKNSHNDSNKNNNSNVLNTTAAPRTLRLILITVSSHSKLTGATDLNKKKEANRTKYKASYHENCKFAWAQRLLPACHSSPTENSLQTYVYAQCRAVCKRAFASVDLGRARTRRTMCSR